MITTGDVGNILYKEAKQLGLPVYKKGNIPAWDNKERITIHPKKPTTGKYWKKLFVEVNISVPNLSEGKANLTRLTELERIALSHFDSCGVYDGSSYTYSCEVSQEEDMDLKCYFINCRILFEILNV